MADATTETTMKPLRYSTAALMGAVALTAILCALVPYLRASPVLTLTAGTLLVAIFRVANPGRDPRLRRALIFLAVITMLVATVQYSYSLWERAASYRRLAAFHARMRQMDLGLIALTVQTPRRFGGREHLLQWAVYELQLSQKYDRAARSPWLPVEPDPPRPDDPSVTLSHRTN